GTRPRPTFERVCIRTGRARPLPRNELIVTDAHALAGRLAVVIGATGGIGSAVAKTLAGSGATIAIGFRRAQSAADALAASLPPTLDRSGHAAIRCDVTDS